MATLLYSEEQAMTPGERKTATILGEGLPDDWTVICNKMFVSNYGPTREVDFIIVAEGSIILIDEKSWRGRITGSDQIWSREDGSSHYNPLNKLERTARVMVSHLRYRIPHLDQVPEYIEFAIGCVLLTISDEKPKISHDVDRRLTRQVFLLRDAVADIIALDKIGSHKGIARARKDIVDVLFQLKSRPKSPTKINEFTIIETLPSPPYPEIKRYLSRHPDGSLRILTVYELTSLGDENRQFYLREYETLKSLGESGVTPAVDLWFEWSDNQFLVVPTAVPEGTSYGALRSPESLDDLIEEISKSAAIYSALSQMHSKGIVHRTLGLENIYLQETARGYEVTFTGLWAARQRNSYTGTISSQLNEIREGAGAEDLAAAPEIDHGYEFADETSDTYAASIMLLSRLSGERLENLRDETGTVVILKSWDVWRKFGSDIASKLMYFFESTLGADPPIKSESEAQGRKSAEYCNLELVKILSEASTPDNEYGTESQIASNVALEQIIPYEDSERSEIEEMVTPSAVQVDGTDSKSNGQGTNLSSHEGTQALPKEKLFLRYGVTRVQIGLEAVSIGRSADNGLLIPDDYVSNNHAQVVLENGRYFLKDNGSRNGTYVQDERIQNIELHQGDVIRVGRTNIFVEADQSPGIDISYWKVTLLSGPQYGLEINIPAGKTTIGRRADNDIVFASRSVSGVHADLVLDTNGLAVEDRGSTNGTFVNGYRVSTSILEDGNIIEMGDMKIHVAMA